jgi:hypothetical protein
MLQLRWRITAGILLTYTVLTALGLLLALGSDDTSQHLIKELILLPWIVPASAIGLLPSSTAVHSTVRAFWMFLPVSTLLVGLVGYMIGVLLDR